MAVVNLLLWPRFVGRGICSSSPLGHLIIVTAGYTTRLAHKDHRVQAQISGHCGTNVLVSCLNIDAFALQLPQAAANKIRSLHMSTTRSMLLIGAATVLTLSVGFFVYQYVAASNQFLRLVVAG
jgi:hypothetical protein